MPERDPAGVPPREAIDYLRTKGVRAGFSYRDVWREEHGMAFTVAKMMELDLLSDIQESLAEARRQGATYAEWEKEWTEILSKRGWWGRREVTDPETGKRVVAQLGSSRRLQTIWRVNMGQANQAGVWERGQRSRAHPYLLYRVGPSKEHRTQHLAWNGVLLPKDDPFWRVANPINGWGCKCFTRFVSRAQYRRYTTTGAPGVRKVQTGSPALRREVYENPRTGRTYTGVEGIDPGFEYNPGVSRERQLGTQWAQRDAQAARRVRPTPDSTPVASALNTDPAGGQRRQADEALRAIAAVHGATGLPARPLPVRETSDPAYLGRYLQSADGTPKEILLSEVYADRVPALTMAHEIGHFLDQVASGSPPGRENRRESATEATPEMRAVMEAIRRSPTHALMQGLAPKLVLPGELWARAYAQYIAWRSGSAVLRGHLDRMLGHERDDVRARYWPYDEFRSIAEAIDRLLEARGWARRRS